MTRPRSGSHGSNQGFQRPPRVRLDTLGGIPEEPRYQQQQLPEISAPVLSQGTSSTQIQMLDDAAKKFSVTQEMMEEQIQNLVKENMVGGEMAQNIRGSLFPSK